VSDGACAYFIGPAQAGLDFARRRRVLPRGRAGLLPRVQSTRVRGVRSATRRETLVQQVHVQERVEYAGLGYRAAAVILDTLIVLIG
jgi:hypothetical protein